jgi:hypothetical protein
MSRIFNLQIMVENLFFSNGLVNISPSCSAKITNLVMIEPFCILGAFGSAVQPAFQRISNFFFFFFAKIECGLYLLDRFDVLISKMIFKK